MMIKIELVIDENKYNVTNDIVNIAEIKTTYRRSDFGEVIRSASDTFEFAGKAYDLIKNEYLTNYLDASAIIIISLSNNIFSYDEKYRNHLDFTTLQDDGMIITLYTQDDSLARKIKDNKSQMYDIPVYDINKGEYLFYERMELINKCSWYLYLDVMGKGEYFMQATMPNYNTHNVSIPLAIDSYNFETQYATFHDVYNNSPSLFFIEVNEDHSFYFDFDLKVTLTDFTPYEGQSPDKFVNLRMIRSYKVNDRDVNEVISGLGTGNLKKGDIVHYKTDKNKSYSFKAGDKIRFYLYSEYYSVSLKLYDVKSLNVTSLHRNENINIDIVTPLSLLSSIIKNIAGGNIPCEIRGTSFNSIMMCAAESIRGISEAKFHTSFSKFCDWMNCFGYAYSIQSKNGIETVVFDKRSSFYDDSDITEIREISNFRLVVNKNIIYSGVEVGYEKNDYDEVNGRYEFNVKNSFNTGAKGEDKILKLISPFRADSYGIEFLSQERNDTENSDSDNDIFFIGIINSGNNKFIVDRSLSIAGSIPTGSNPKYKAFNAMFSPRHMLLHNIDYIGCCTKSLIFTATEGNADISINGVSEKTAINILEKERLFRVETINVETPNINNKNINPYGLILFKNNGLIYKGYINDLTEDISVNMSEYELICKSIT
ncbi:MAG: hypothetical protein PUB21_07930 [Bacteroidales bacterium]|nr:hypothetical protein [Bacteroidales bacterium]